MTKIPEGFENHNLMEHLALSHMASTCVRTPLNSIIGFSRVLLKGLDGPINAQQRTDLEAIQNSAVHLLEHMDVFLYAVPFIFGKEHLYVADIDLRQIISRLISQIQQKTQFRIEQDIPTSLPSIKADGTKIYQALYNIVGLVQQIHPTSEGKLGLTVGYTEECATVTVSAEQGKLLQTDVNLELFIAQSIAKAHGGKLQIENDSNNDWMIVFVFPIRS